MADIAIKKVYDEEGGEFFPRTHQEAVIGLEDALDGKLPRPADQAPLEGQLIRTHADGTTYYSSSGGGGGYEPPITGIPKSDLDPAVQHSLDLADSALQAEDIEGKADITYVDEKDAELKEAIDAKYTKPTDGIPKDDLAYGVQRSLEKAETALQQPDAEGIKGQVLVMGEDNPEWQDILGSYNAELLYDSANIIIQNNGTYSVQNNNGVNVLQTGIVMRRNGAIMTCVPSFEDASFVALPDEEKINCFIVRYLPKGCQISYSLATVTVTAIEPFQVNEDMASVVCSITPYGVDTTFEKIYNIGFSYVAESAYYAAFDTDALIVELDSEGKTAAAQGEPITLTAVARVGTGALTPKIVSVGSFSNQYLQDNLVVTISDDKTKLLITWAEGATMASGTFVATIQDANKAERTQDATIIVACSRKGNAGKGIAEVKSYYLATTKSSGVTIEGEQWSEQMQTITAVKKYLWTYSVTLYSDGQSVTVQPHIIGVYGDKGEQGEVAYENYITPEETTLTIQPNTLYEWTEAVASLYIFFALPDRNDIVNEYHFRFVSGTTPTLLSLPEEVVFQTDLEVEANKVYEISVINNKGLWCVWEG